MKLVGERRALSAATFAFYFLFFLLPALLGSVPPENARVFYALAGCYGLAFFSLVAGYFWARWYAVGLGLFGVILASLGMWQLGPEPIFMFIGGTHLAATVLLWGEAMSEGYDGQTAWRERFHMDENAVHRLGRSVIRAGVSLPFVLLYALSPKPASEMVVSLAALLLTGVGFRGLVRVRTWGIFAVGAAGVLLVALAAGDVLAHGEVVALRPALGGALLLSAAAPWARPIARLLGGG
jgi:hypothetical protein